MSYWLRTHSMILYLLRHFHGRKRASVELPDTFVNEARKKAVNWVTYDGDILPIVHLGTCSRQKGRNVFVFIQVFAKPAMSSYEEKGHKTHTSSSAQAAEKLP